MSVSFVTRQVYRWVAEAARLVRKGLKQQVTVEIKEGPGDDLHSVLTQLDLDSQALIINGLAGTFPEMWFLAEEASRGERVVTDDNRGRLFDTDVAVCVIDSLDGTTAASRQRWDWAVCAHVVTGNEYFGGAIVAPDVRGGLQVVAEAGRGAWIREGGSTFDVGQLKSTCVSKVSELRLATVLFGTDLPRYREWLPFLGAMAGQTQALFMAGSCALGVATVVAGRAEALIQMNQWPWDWVSAWMIQEAGGKVLWFNSRNGCRPVQVDNPDLAAYSRTDRVREGGLSFIAGNPQVVDALWSLLQETWQPA